MLIILYGPQPDEGRYSPGQCIGAEPRVVIGYPDPEAVSTSHVERQNLTVRMSMRRFTRLTKAFSKKANNLRAAIALHFMYYSSCCIHKTLETTPATAAGVIGRRWTVRDIAQARTKLTHHQSGEMVRRVSSRL